MTRPDCYACVHRTPIAGDAHSECRHPAATLRAGIQFLTTSLSRLTSPEPPSQVVVEIEGETPIEVGFQDIGIRRGWATWPLRFDPTWLTTCTGWQAILSPEPSE